MTMLGKRDGLVYLSELRLSSPGWRSYKARNKMISGAGSSSTEIQLNPRKDNIHECCSSAPDLFRELEVCTDWPDLCHVMLEIDKYNFFQ